MHSNTIMPFHDPESQPGTLSTSWATLAAYQAGDPRRQASREVLFGSTWYTRRDLPPWRAVWLQTTGEFIVVHLDGAHEAEYGPRG
jgi:hypothetical protein